MEAGPETTQGEVERSLLRDPRSVPATLEHPDAVGEARPVSIVWGGCGSPSTKWMRRTRPGVGRPGPTPSGVTTMPMSA